MVRGLEEEISGVPDPVVRTKKKLPEILTQLPTLSPSYEPLHIEERASAHNLPRPDMTPEEIFSLFLSNNLLEQIAENTNLNASLRAVDLEEWDQGETIHPAQRPWTPTTGPEVGVFLGIMIYMGLDTAHSTKAYWNTDSSLPIYTAITETMSLKRFEQMKRYLKISNVFTEEDPSGPYFFDKIGPLHEHFVRVSKELLVPGRNVSVDEQLLKFKGRSKHTMMMNVKAAGKGFKIYSLCAENYIYAFKWTSKSTRITGLKKLPGLSPSESLVVQLCKELPDYYDGRYACYMDNFFTSIKLFKHLRGLNIAAVGTCKSGSGFPRPLLELRSATKKKNDWELLHYYDVENVLCIAWCDNNLAQLMTTLHSGEEVEEMHWIDAKKRTGIPPNLFTLRDIFP